MIDVLRDGPGEVGRAAPELGWLVVTAWLGSGFSALDGGRWAVTCRAGRMRSCASETGLSASCHPALGQMLCPGHPAELLTAHQRPPATNGDGRAALRLATSPPDVARLTD